MKITSKTLKFSFSFNKPCKEQHPWEKGQINVHPPAWNYMSSGAKYKKTTGHCVPVQSQYTAVWKADALLLSWLSSSTLSRCEGCLCLSSTQHCSSTLSDVYEVQWLFVSLLALHILYRVPVEWWVWFRLTTSVTPFFLRLHLLQEGC